MHPFADRRSAASGDCQCSCGSPFAAPLVWLLKVTKIKVGMVYGKDFGYAKGVKCEVTLTDSPKIWPSRQLIRAGRGLVGIDQKTLAKKAGVSRKAVVTIEADESDKMDPRRLKVLQKLQRVLEDIYGIEFFPASEQSGEGVRFRKK